MHRGKTDQRIEGRMCWGRQIPDCIHPQDTDGFESGREFQKKIRIGQSGAIASLVIRDEHYRWDRHAGKFVWEREKF
jgi:hypothetical protein